jgi:hypothetical protein
MARWEGFQQCPGCGYDIFTGEGVRGCAWGDCPYLPDELNFLCDYCRFNFFTMEGNPPCDDPEHCEHGIEARRNVTRIREWAAARAQQA